MVALAAAIVFLIALVTKPTTGDFSWVTLGLLLLSLHFVFDFAVPGIRRRI